LTPSGPPVCLRSSLPRDDCPKKRQAAPRFAPEIPLSSAAVPHPSSPASAEPVALSKSTHLRRTHPNPTIPLPLKPSPRKSSFLGASPPKQVSAPTGRNSFLFSPTTCRSCFMGAREGGWWGSEARLRGHHRRQECRQSVGWATLLSPLQHGSLPTKTSFGPDGKKQLSFPTNDLQKLFLSSTEINRLRSDYPLLNAVANRPHAMTRNSHPVRGNEARSTPLPP
jgi:hypothetical protein